MTTRRDGKGMLIIERTPAELLTIANEYLKSATGDYEGVIERLIENADPEAIQQDIKTAENSLLAAMRFLEDFKKKFDRQLYPDVPF